DLLSNRVGTLTRTVAIDRLPRALTVARVQAIDISLDWRWAPVLALGTWLLAQNVLPARFPTWPISMSWLIAAAAVLAGEVALLLMLAIGNAAAAALSLLPIGGSDGARALRGLRRRGVRS